MASPAAAPRLLRAVAETTQPYGPLLEGNALNTLQEYLSDSTQVDTVYLTVLNRATGEPLSLAVVDKCVALLKRYLPRYKASQQVLDRAEDFCAQANTTLSAMSPAMQKSLKYLQTMVTRLMGSQRQRRLSKHSPPAQHQKSSSDTPVTMPISTMSRAFSSPAPTLAHQMSKSSTRSVSHRLSEQLNLEEDPPSNWAIHHDMLAARFGSTEPDADICERMAAFLPSLPYNSTDEEEPEEADDSHLGGNSQEHVRSIAAVQRVQASQANFNNDPAHDMLRPKLRDNRPRLLFQYLPYIQQEALQLDQQDIEAVLEASFGTTRAHASHPSLWGVENSEDLWRRETGRAAWGGVGGPQGDSAGQVCAGILVKLVLDMYLKATPAVAFPLTLVMMHRALDSPSSSIRARPFDILYNLSLHAELLYSPARDSNQALPESLDPDSVLEGAWAHSRDSSEWPQPQGLEAPLQAFRHWLRHLLWELTSLLTQREERSPQVWSAVLGCLMHLVSHCGFIVRGYLEGLSMRVVAALMQCCLEQRWCHTVYCQLTRITANMMYVATPSADVQEMRKAEPQQPAASLQLSQDLLSQFGGITQVVAHFKAAPTAEAARNLLVVILDHAAILAAQGIDEEAQDVQQDSGAESLAAVQTSLAPIMTSFTSNHVPAAIQTIFKAGEADFASSLADTLRLTIHQDSLQASDDHTEQQDHAVLTVLEQLRSMACTDIATPSPFLPALEHTLERIRRPYLTPPDPPADPRTYSAGSFPESYGSQEMEPVTMDEAWQCLAELLCEEEDNQAAIVGQIWLYRLLKETAEQHMCHPGHHPQLPADFQSEINSSESHLMSPRVLHQDGDCQMGLLPHPLGGHPKADAPAHLTNQPQLAQLLNSVLSFRGGSINTSSIFVSVIKRLALHLKLKCTVTPSEVDSSQQRTSQSSDQQAFQQVADQQQDPAKQEDLLATAVDPGMTSMQSGSANSSSDYPHIDPLASLDIGSRLMRTSPALSWGKPTQDSEARSHEGEGRSVSTDGGASSVGPSRGHHRTLSEPRGLLISAAVAQRGQQGTGQAGNAARAASSALTNAELSGILREGEGSGLSHEGIVLHDAPVLGRHSPQLSTTAQEADQGPDAENSQQQEGQGQNSSSGPWQAGMAAGLVLSTLYLTLEWLLQAPTPNRQAALEELAQLLLLFVCTPAAPTDTSHAASPPLTPRQPTPSQVTIDIPANDPAHVTIRMPSPQGTASPTPAHTPRTSHHQAPELQAGLAAPSCLAWCFLNGLVWVPAPVLMQVAPVLLVRLLHHLTQDATPTTDSGSTNQPLHQGLGQGAQDTRVALVLLLIARCNMEPTALQQAGGEALFAELLRDADARVRYHASIFVQQRLVATKADQYRRALRQLTQQAQQANDEKLLSNPYLQISTMLEMRLIDLSI